MQHFFKGMPAASVEVSIGSLLISNIKILLFKKFWVKPDNIDALALNHCVLKFSLKNKCLILVYAVV